MRCTLFLVGLSFLLAPALAAAQDKKKGDGKLPALAFDCKVVKIEEAKKGEPAKLYYQTSEEDQKKLGIGAADTPLTRNTKLVFVGPDGEKAYTLKAAQADDAVKKYLAADSKVRIQATAAEVEELRFGPDLKPMGPKRVR